MSGTSSGAKQGMLPPTMQWMQDGLPTPAFFELIRALYNRTGGSDAPTGPGGSIGLAALQAEVQLLSAEAQVALELGNLGVMLADEYVPPPINSSSVSSDADFLTAMIADGPYATPQGLDGATLLALALGDSGHPAPTPAVPSVVYAPLVNGDLPGPTAIADPYGQFIMVPVT